MPWNEADRAKYAVIRDRYSSDMSEAEFALIAPLLPAPKKRGRKPTCQRRSKFTSICRSDSAAFWLAGSHSMRLACWRGVHSVWTGPDSGSTLGRRVWRLL